MPSLQIHGSAVLGKRTREKPVVRGERSCFIDNCTCVRTEDEIKRSIVFDITLHNTTAYIIHSRSVASNRIGDRECPVIDDLATLNRMLFQRNRDVLA